MYFRIQTALNANAYRTLYHVGQEIIVFRSLFYKIKLARLLKLHCCIILPYLSRERAKYEPVMQCSVPVWPVQNKANTDGTEQSNKMAEPNEPNFDLFSSLHLTFNISVNNKTMTLWSRSNSETKEGVWIFSFALFSSLARAYEFDANLGQCRLYLKSKNQTTRK